MFRTFSKNSDKRLTIYELAYPNLNKKKKKGGKKNQKQEKKRAIDRIPSYRSESNLYDFEDYRILLRVYCMTF